MKVLRVLDLEGITSRIKDDDLEQIGETLPRLKFLSLRGCRDITRLPKSLDSLRQLQTLDIRHTAIVKLPKYMINLRQLQYIRAGTNVPLMDHEPYSLASGCLPSCSASAPWRSRQGHLPCDGVKVPKGIRKLMALHTLGVINIGTTGGKAVRKELKNLTHLRKLGVSGISPRNSKGFFSAIADHGHLESLSLRLQEDNDLVWLGDINPPENLRCLKLSGYVNQLTQWNRYFQNLTMLSIEITVLLTQEEVQVVGMIKTLETLRLRFKLDQDLDQDCELQFCVKPDGAARGTPDLFGKLKVLEITCSSSLHVKFARNAVQKLELLKVHCLDGSALQFSGLNHPYSLKQVFLKGSFNDTVKAAVWQVLSSHLNEPALKLEQVLGSSR